MGKEKLYLKLDNCLKMISKGEIEEVLEIMINEKTSNFTDYIQLSNRYFSLKQQSMKGIVSQSDFVLEANRISDSLISLINLDKKGNRLGGILSRNSSYYLVFVVLLVLLGVGIGYYHFFSLENPSIKNEERTALISGVVEILDKIKEQHDVKDVINEVDNIPEQYRRYSNNLGDLILSCCSISSKEYKVFITELSELNDKKKISVALTIKWSSTITNLEYRVLGKLKFNKDGTDISWIPIRNSGYLYEADCYKKCEIIKNLDY